MKSDKNSRSEASAWMANIGMIIILVAMSLPLFLLNTLIARYIFAVGAILTLTGRIIAPRIDKANLRARRLQRMELWSAILFCASAAAMFYPGLKPTDWLAFAIAAAVLQAYASIMLPKVLKRVE